MGNWFLGMFDGNLVVVFVFDNGFVVIFLCYFLVFEFILWLIFFFVIFGWGGLF